MSQLWTYTKCWVKWFFVILWFWFGHGRTFLDTCQLVLLRWLLFQSYGEFVDASCIPNLLCQCCLSHICVVFCSKEVSLCRPSQRILSYISWPSLVSSWFAIIPISVWWPFLHLVRGRRPQSDFGIFSFFVTSLGCVYHTTCYTDIGIGELVIHFTLRHGSTVYCSWPWFTLLLSWICIVYFWRPCSNWAWVCPP